jgi:hypothetical protein
MGRLVEVSSEAALSDLYPNFALLVDTDLIDTFQINL